MDPQNSGVDIFGDVSQSLDDLLTSGIKTLGAVGVRDGVQTINGYTGVYGDPSGQTLYPGDVYMNGGGPIGVVPRAAAPATDSSFLLLAAAAYFFLR